MTSVSTPISYAVELPSGETLGLFETHPPLEQRIAALQEVAGSLPPAS